MPRTSRSLALQILIAFALLSSPGIASTQTPPATGTPPFGSFGGGPDVINLANLNSHITIPILHKAGRGTNFTYDLVYDSSIWYPAASGSTTTWQMVSSSSLPGWQAVSPVGQSYIGYSTNFSSGQCTNNGSTFYTWTNTSYGGFYYYDQYGVRHNFSSPIGWFYITNTGAGICGPTPGFSPSSAQQSSVATDGSGLTFNVTPVATGVPPAYVMTSSGTKVTPPLILSGSTSGLLSATDRNGNQVSVDSSGHFYDTLSSSTAVLTVAGVAPTNTTFTYTAPSGASAAYTMKYTNYKIQTNFGCTNITDYGTNGTTTANLVSEIDLPDGSKYTFAYESTPSHSGYVTGRLYQITLPTGGTITYTYSGGNNGIICSDGSTAGLQRTLTDSILTWSATWNYSRSIGSGAASTTTITDPTTPTANQTVIQFQGIYETQRQVYQGSSTSGTLLATTNTCYNGTVSPASTAACISTAVALPIMQRAVTTTLPGSPARISQHIDDFNTVGMPTESDDYDYGSGALGLLLRKILYTYASLGNITAFRQQVTVQNGAGATIAQTNYNYDETAVVATTSTPQHTSVTSSRGNLTSINYLVSGLTSHSTYFDTGNLQTFTDVNSAQTTYTYGACGNSFPTNVAEPLSLSRSMSWNCTGGVQLASTDENSATSSSTYSSDPDYWRPDFSTDPLGNNTTYFHQQNPTYTLPFGFGSFLVFNSNNSQTSAIQYVDGFGRKYVDQHTQNPGSSTTDAVSYTYDANGRPYSVSMPCSPGWSGTCSTPQTTTTYDALNRVLQTTDAGTGYVSYSYNQNDVLVTVGPNPSGENTKQRQLEYDALGRLTSVCEVTAGTTAWPGGSCGQNTARTGYLTKYSYDALGNLTGVTQNAQSTSNQQTRSYSYDAMSRLISETNPESGTTTYTYDTVPSSCYNYGDNQKGGLVEIAEANGNIICNHYDALHRLSDVGSNTGCKRFRYDNSTGVLGSIPSGVTVSNGLGRLVEAETDTCAAWPPTTSMTSDEWFSYTARGETSDAYQWTPHSGGYYHVNQTYWASGAPQTLSQLSGLPSITYGGTIGSTVGLDGEGRITQVTASSGQNPVSGVTYNAGSLPTQVNFGSGDSDAFTYDPNTMRMTQFKFNVGTSSQSLTGGLTWNANASLNQLAITDQFNSADTQTCNYVHDDLVRLASTNCGTTTWQQNFSYDPFGNIVKTVPTGGTGNSFQPTYNSATNRFATIPGATPSYDANGNVLSDGSHTYAWDAFNNSSTVDGVGLIFDAFDRMVEQNRSGSYSQVVYTPSGTKLARLSGTTLQWGYVPLPGQATAVYTSSGLLHYRHSDWLGSSRLISSPSRAYLSSVAYAPFGENYAGSGGVDLSFTGQNMDTSSDYDFLYREYSSQGRWASPDPAGLAAVDPTNPQSWNRYAYVLNNPLSAIDPLGLDCVFLNDAGDGIQEVAPELGADSCGEQGGVYFAGSIDPNSIQFDPNSDFVFALGTSGDSQFSCGGTNCDQNSLDAFSNSLFGQSTTTVTAQDPWSWTITFTQSFLTFAGGPGNVPTCAGVTLRSMAGELADGVMGGAPAAETALKAASVQQAARATAYAASRTNSLGGVGLLVPNRSSVFRGMMSKAKFLGEASEALPLLEVSVAAGRSIPETSEQARSGECAAAFPIF